MQILCTGGAGFIGSNLVDRLVSDDHKVIVIDDLSNGVMKNLDRVSDKITFLRRDISRPFYKEFPKITECDLIYHLACFPRSMSFNDPVRDVEVNVIGMINMLELARLSDARVIFSSNSGIYQTDYLPINEETPDHPTTPYDLDKLMAEKYLELYRKTYGIKYINFRFATVFGPRQRTSPDWKPVVIEFIEKISHGMAPTIYWDGLQTRDFIFVDDIVDGLILAQDSYEALGETIILGSGVETSISELFKMVCNVLEVNIDPKWGPKALGDIARMRYDCRKAERVLKWKAKTSLMDGIKDILEKGVKTT